VQIFEYADNTDIVEQSQAVSKRQQETSHLQNNQDKVKHMPVRKKDSKDSLSRTRIVPYKSETLNSFTYQGPDVNCKNDISAEIKRNAFSLQMFTQT
jgi:hypothetical protein